MHTYSLFVISIQIFAFRICLTFFLFFILFLSFFHRSFLSAKHHGRFLPTIRDKVLLLSLVLCISFSVLCFLTYQEKRTGREKDYRAYPTNRRSIVRLVSPLLPYNIKNLYMEVLNRYNRYKLFIPKMSRTRRSYYRSIRRYFVQRYFISFYTY